MNQSLGENWWYSLYELIGMNGIGYALLFISLVIWSRLLLMVAECMAKPCGGSQPLTPSHEKEGIKEDRDTNNLDNGRPGLFRLS